jgi:rhodanese-related sulfurtransferase
MRAALGFAVAAGVLMGAAAPAAPPEYPVVFITVDELKAMVDGGAPVDIIDVRTRSEYEQLHITGARSIPLRDLPERLREISKTRTVVFY